MRVTARTDRLLLANAIMGQFLTGVATRIFVVALPTLAVALDTDIIAISWALIVYQLAGISLSVVFGRLDDIHGRYAIYGLGFAIMTVSFVLCGLAPNAFVLIVFRLVQGLERPGEQLHNDGLSLQAPDRAAARRAGHRSARLALDLLPDGADGPRGRRPDGAARAKAAHVGAGPARALDRLPGRSAPDRAHGDADAAARPAQRRGARGRAYGRGIRDLRRHPRGFSRARAARHQPRREPGAVLDPHVHVQRAEPSAHRHHHQRDELPDAVLHPGRPGLLGVVHGAHLPGSAGLHDRPRRGQRPPHRSHRPAHPRLDRRAGHDERLRHRARLARGLALDPADPDDGAPRRGLGLLQHPEPGGHHRLGAPRVPGLRDRHGPDGLRHLGAARDLAGRRALDPGVSLLHGRRRRHAERRTARTLRVVDERGLPGVPGAPGH